MRRRLKQCYAPAHDSSSFSPQLCFSISLIRLKTGCSRSTIFTIRRSASIARDADSECRGVYDRPDGGAMRLIRFWDSSFPEAHTRSDLIYSEGAPKSLDLNS